MTTQQILNELTNDEYMNLPRLGWVFTYNVDKEVEALTKKQVTEILERNGYDANGFNHITPQKAYHVAKVRMQKTNLNADPKILLRPVTSKSSKHIVHQVTIETLATVKSGNEEIMGLEHDRHMFITFDKEKAENGEHPISFSKEGNRKMTSADKTFATDFEAEYNKVLNHLLANDLYNWIWKTKNGWNTVSWRTTGGMFFAPDQHTPQVERMVKCIEDFGHGCIFKRIPVLNFPEHRKDVAESFNRDMEERIKELNDDLEELLKKGRADGTLPEKMLKDRLKKYNGIMSEAQMYGTMLQHRSDIVDKALGVIKDKVENVLAGKFKGVKAEISKAEQKAKAREERRKAREAAKAAKEEEKAQAKKAKAESKKKAPEQNGTHKPASKPAPVVQFPKGYKFDKPAEVKMLKAYGKEIGKRWDKLNFAQKVTACTTDTVAPF
jgi:hypothetical protein